MCIRDSSRPARLPASPRRLAQHHTQAVFADPSVNEMLAVSEENQLVYTVGFWVMVILTALVLILLVLWRSKIARAVAIVKETCRVFATLPSLMIFPFTTVIAEAVVCVWAIVIGDADAVPTLGSRPPPRI